MGRAFLSRHCLWLSIGIGAVALSAPAAARADDAVEVLKKSLKDGGVEQIAKDTAALNTLSELRRGYFLSGWPSRRDAADLEKRKENAALAAQMQAVLKLRDALGDRLEKEIRKRAAGDLDRKIAACIMIAEIADKDEPDQASATGKYASRFSDLLLGLVASQQVGVRQAALHALGKVTPPPEKALPALRAVLSKDDLGPRRLAAYALADLVKNASFLKRKEEMATINLAVAEAARVLRLGNQDDQIRGYCLQTILTSARIFTEYRWTTSDPLAEPIVQVGVDNKLDASLRDLLKSYQGAMEPILSALESDASPNIRLAAFETISQLITSRSRLCEDESNGLRAIMLQKKLGKDTLSRSEVLALFDAPDPIAPLLAGRWEVIPSVLKQSDDIRLKRGLMSLMERVAEDVEAALEARKQEKMVTQESIRKFVQSITPALSDPDRYVRWTAARTLRHLSPKYIEGDVILALGHMLIDPQQRDPDLTAAAAATIEAVATSPYAARAVLFLRSAIADPTMDSANRVAAMKALVAIGAQAANQTAANEAFPELTGAVGADDAAVRREACLTLGQLGHPATPELYAAAIAALKLAMRDDDTDVRLNASEAILSITPPR